MEVTMIRATADEHLKIMQKLSEELTVEPVQDCVRGLARLMPDLEHRLSADDMMALTVIGAYLWRKSVALREEEIWGPGEMMQ
jgi:hypothetical protein